jgi:hypothetical protein
VRPLAVLDHLSHPGDPGGAQQLTQLFELGGLPVRQRRDQIRALAGTTLRTRTVGG